jgi:glutamate N-acetyltransferase/amino-acid N-acetyltransferase
MEDARSMADQAATAMGLLRREVLVASTGIIGVPLPMGRLSPGIPKAVEALNRSRKNGAAAARAIMTSDTVEKEVAVSTEISGAKIVIGAIAKGAGMINPNMATMLCFITTDADIDKEELQRATSLAVEDSFNRITIDGDMSTNDTVLVMANGAAGNRKIQKGKPGSRQFREALTEVMLRMAKKIVSDGERVTKLVEVNVAGAANLADAEKVARAVCTSSLVKSSWNGNDPNWGRIIHAIGYSEAKLRPETIDIYFGGICAAKGSLATEVPYRELVKVVSKREFCVCINLNVGRSAYAMYASDLSPEYVDFNRSEYSALTHK